MFVWVKRVILALVVLFMIAQFIRPSRTNPPVDPTLEINASQSVGPAPSACATIPRPCAQNEKLGQSSSTRVLSIVYSDLSSTMLHTGV
jgi:hypothetical protein